MTDFRDLIGPDELPPEEEARLRRVHELLVQAGPPADLPPQLLRPPVRPPDAEVVPFPRLPRRIGSLALVAAAVAVAAFGGGYLFGHAKAKPAVFVAARSVPMHGAGATAELRIAKRDSVGNWPMQMVVTGLPKQTARNAYYELWLTRNGKPSEACGQFRVHGKTTRLTFTVPWSSGGIDGWVVTVQKPGEQGAGPVVLTT